MSQVTLREVHGRGMNTLSKQYKLPADAQEMDRLSLQHRMWCMLLGGLYPSFLKSEIESMFSRTNMGTSLGSETSTILDIGCGSGIWALDMAKAFPHVQVVGIDLIENPFPDPPANISYLQCDATLGLPQYRKAFDLVHARLVVGQLADPGAFVRILSHTLKPGGILILSDGDPRIYDENKTLMCPLFPDSPASDTKEKAHFSYLAGWMTTWSRMVSSPKYKPVDVLVKENGVWAQSGSQLYFSPVNWEGIGVEDGESLGAIMRVSVSNFAKATMPTFYADSGYPVDAVDRWYDLAEKETETRRLYTLWNVAYGILSKE